MPGKFESGNLNVPGIVGLGAGADYLHLKSLQQIRQHELELTERLLAGLQELPAIKIYGPTTATERVGLVSFNIEGYDPQEVAALLDASFRIQVRPGLHCAPRMHNRLGTAKRGGTVRLSFSSFTTNEDVDATIGALKQLSAG
jgi:selenocysteine lyase/cysteine desulfurase